MSLLDHYADQLDSLKHQGQLRQFTSAQQDGRWIMVNDHQMLNLSSNDYLGLAQNTQLVEEFFDLMPTSAKRMSSSSSRLLTGNFAEYEALEQALSDAFLGRAALLFNSGYHMNIGILPALCDVRTLILSDKLIHASMIDGIRLSKAQYYRYRHNDLTHLEQLLSQYHGDDKFDRIIVVTESIFSMDGDETDLKALVAIKSRYTKVMLYVDEAHAIGVRGERGLGCAEQYAVIAQIDFLVGTFGKALASVGGYLICDPIIRTFLINHMRPLIFSTAQPPINMAWTQFIFSKMQDLNAQRLQLKQLSQQIQTDIRDLGYACPSSSHIVPIIIGEAQATIDKAKQLQQAGFYIMPVRPPTVPKGGSRLRVCLNTTVDQQDVINLLKHLAHSSFKS
ncbi:8-amino-7-oxononanoate synthase [Acinetobacter shaoyimingii]|uniref:8-amino-7-oxononanoate synthase n=1 Tax=Acinetobacter shaoyimingii TaxID=2715164 RepID=A0A6G8RY10_9GAMM|nr:8-amino-7-oxononanoate synthase [Acinetobacter shaoyimingii]QIO06755.1 8-amino-7-oxononanoate synthase [Acinetobacter shaoyimingii]